MKKGDRVKVEFEGELLYIYPDGVVKIGLNKEIPDYYWSLVHESQCTVIPDPEPEIALAGGKVWLRLDTGWYWAADHSETSYTWHELVDQRGAVPAMAVTA
jgi:hypothetical protein